MIVNWTSDVANVSDVRIDGRRAVATRTDNGWVIEIPVRAADKPLWSFLVKQAEIP